MSLQAVVNFCRIQSLPVCRYEDVRVGESAELLLLSNTPNFSSFKVGQSVQ